MLNIQYFPNTIYEHSIQFGKIMLLYVMESIKYDFEVE